MRVAVVTGANTGVGKDTALGLCQKGFHVVMACRSEARGAAAAEWVRERCSGGSIEVQQLDLVDFASVVRFADALGSHALCRQSGLQVLVLNAGVGGTNRTSAALPDGADSVYRTNFVSHFVLTVHLLPLLRRAGRDPAQPARVVALSSVMHRWGVAPARWLEPLTQRAEFAKTQPFGAYATSKLTMACLAAEVTRRYRDAGVVGIAVNPGAVNSDIWYRNEAWGDRPEWQKRALSTFFRLTFLTNEQGASASVSAATEGRWLAELADESVLYLCPYRTPWWSPLPFELWGPYAGPRPCRPHSAVYDAEACREMWDGLMRADSLAPCLPGRAM